MSQIYNYSFDTALPLAYSNAEYPKFAQFYGAIQVDYARVSASGYSFISSDAYVDGAKLTTSLLSQTVNADGTTTYSATLYNNITSDDVVTRNVMLSYVGENPAQISNVRLWTYYTDFTASPPRDYSATYEARNAPVTSAPVCYVAGTRIRTSRGQVAVEELNVGDMAVTASGTLRPIAWIGHREMEAAGAVLPFQQQPVRVRAGAFGQDLPARDLSLSPGHPVLVGADADNEGGVLVPIMCLINGTTVTREPRASVTYWHVELDAHDILLAEGLPAESYIDGGDRAFFVEASDHALHNPDFVPPGWGGRCRPVAVDGRFVETERLRLNAVFASSLNVQCAWENGNQLPTMIDLAAPSAFGNG